MLKRILIGGLIAVLLIAVTVFLLISKTDPFQEAKISEAVPGNAILFVEKLDYEFIRNEFRSENLMWKDMLSVRLFANADSFLTVFDEYLMRMPVLSELIAENGINLSLHLLGKQNQGVMFYIPVGEGVSSGDLREEVTTVVGDEALINERRYEAVTLSDLSFRDDRHSGGFSFAFKDGLMLLSSSSILVEDAIRSLNSDGGIFYKEGFRKVSATAGKYVYGNIYLNYKNLPYLLYPLLETNILAIVDPLAEFADWGEFDLDVRKDAVVLNGMSTAGDSVAAWLNLFTGQSPVRSEVMSSIPSNVTDYTAIGISDTKRFLKELKREMDNRGELKKYMDEEQSAEATIGVKPMEAILNLVNDEIAWFNLINNENKSYEEVLIYEVRSRSEAREELTNWVRLYEMEDQVTTFVLDDQATFEIYSLPTNIHTGPLAGKFLKTRFAFYDNYIIFAESVTALSRTIYQNVLHKTLDNEPRFEEIKNLLSTRSNLTCMIHPDQFVMRNGDFFSGKTSSIAKEMETQLKKIPGIIIQFSNENEMFYSAISLKYASTIKEKAMTVWESLLDSVVILKPQLVTNHNTSDKEIIVQDASQNLSLVNSTGRVIWKLPLEEPIMSEIYQVDYFQNGKLQYLFNTAESLHLVDRNGNYVERYPVRLRSDATNGMALFDYDNRNEYRIFISGSDRKIYVYDLEGNIVSGWEFSRTEGIVRKPIQHFRIAEKDYIVLSDEIRTYFLNRRGNERIKTMKPVTVSANNLFYLDMNISGDGPRFVTTDTSGSVVGIDESGNVSKILDHSATQKHFFRIKDLDRDGVPEYIYANGSELEILDFSGKRIFSFKLKSEISTLPDIYEFSASDLKIGITDEKRNKIYLLNSDGSLYEGFPLEGNTRFSIGYFAGSDSRFNLIVGSNNGFLYNYSIE